MLLFEKVCIPCQGGEKPFTKDLAQDLKSQIHPDWELIDDATQLKRRFRFKNFKDAMTLAVKVGDIAEEQYHHPDMEMGWGRLVVIITTHKIKGLVESDFIFAAKVDKAYQDMFG